MLVLDILDHAADQFLGAVGRRVDCDELEGAGGGHGVWLALDDQWVWGWGDKLLFGLLKGVQGLQLCYTTRRRE